LSALLRETAALFASGLVLNLPFGWLRAGARRFSVAWFAYIHLPIPVLFLACYLLGLSAWAIPFSLGAAALGQLWGGSLRARSGRDAESHGGE